MKKSTKKLPSPLTASLLLTLFIILLAVVELFWSAFVNELIDAGLEGFFTKIGAGELSRPLIGGSFLFANVFVMGFSVYKGVDLFEDLCRRFSAVYDTKDAPVKFSATLKGTFLFLTVAVVVAALIGLLADAKYQIMVIVGLIFCLSPGLLFVVMVCLFLTARTAEQCQCDSEHTETTPLESSSHK